MAKSLASCFFDWRCRTEEALVASTPNEGVARRCRNFGSRPTGRRHQRRPDGAPADPREGEIRRRIGQRYAIKHLRGRRSFDGDYSGFQRHLAQCVRQWILGLVRIRRTDQSCPWVHFVWPDPTQLIHRVKWCHRIYGHDAIAILWV